MTKTAYYLCCALITLAAGHLCSAFDVANVDYQMGRQFTFGAEVLVPALKECAEEWSVWGVQLGRMRLYSRYPRRYRSNNRDYDCAWGCFFRNMGWLDDVEGTFRAYIMLPDMERYISKQRIESAKVAASRCIYVNFPHRPPEGRVPDCEQAKLLKDCFIKETLQNITAEDKFQFEELLHDWAWICAETWGVPVELLERQMGRPGALGGRPAAAGGLRGPDPDELGCVWRCLFIDLGWIEPEYGMFVLSIVQETIKLYYSVEDKITQLVDVATRCVTAANTLSEVDSLLPHGCGRSNYLVECLLRDFFNKNSVNVTPSH